MSPSTAASLPLPSGRPEVRRPIAIATATIAEPEAPAAVTPITVTDELVHCGWCKAFGPSWQIPGDHGWNRCADVAACIKRYLDGGLPGALEPSAATPLTPLPEREPRPVAEPEPVPALPPAQEAALGRLTEAWGEDPETRTEDEEPAKAVAEPPASDGDGAEPDAAPVVAEGSAPAGTPGEVG